MKIVVPVIQFKWLFLIVFIFFFLKAIADLESRCIQACLLPPVEQCVANTLTWQWGLLPTVPQRVEKAEDVAKSGPIEQFLKDSEQH